jgi:alcohol dehydrogenase class IV
MWYFVSPQIVFGEDALDALDDVKGTRALLVTDATLVKVGLVDTVTAHLRKAGIAWRVFDAVEPDPSTETALAGARVALEYEPDWIIAVGGGSVMDAAKAIWILYERPDLEPADINPMVDLNLRRKARLITIPTTSGTGSEVTWAIVLTDTAERRKMSLGNRENTADLAIVDPAMVMGMPSRLTADTGLDALTHAIEGYTCTWHTDLTDGLCLDAAKKIFTYLPRAVADGSDAEARERLHNAATAAGLGFGNSLASMAHATGHALGAVFHIPHGRAVSLLLPYTIEYMAAEAPERFAEVAQFIGCGCDDVGGAALRLAAEIRHLCDALGSPTSIAALGIDRETFVAHIDDLMERAFNDASMMTAARSPDYDELQRLFEYAYDGKPIDF